MIKLLMVALSLLPFVQDTPKLESVFVSLGVSMPGGFMPAQRILFLEFIPADGKVTVRRAVGKEAAETATLDPGISTIIPSAAQLSEFAGYFESRILAIRAFKISFDGSIPSALSHHFRASPLSPR